MQASLITATKLAPAKPAPINTRRCACERLETYGLLCRWCYWQIMTPPPLRAAAFDPRDVHPDAPVRSRATVADLTYSKTASPGELCARRKSQRPPLKADVLRD